MAARQVVGRAGKRNEGDLALSPTADRCCRASAGCRPQSRVERQRRVGIAGIGLGDARASAATVVEVARRPAPRHWRRHRRRAGTPPAAARRSRARPRRGRRRSAERAAAKALIRSRRFMMRSPLGDGLAHELGRGQEQRVPVLRRDRLIERGQRGRAQRLPQSVEVERVRDQRKGRLIDRIRPIRLEQARRSRADLRARSRSAPSSARARSRTPTSSHSHPASRD